MKIAEKTLEDQGHQVLLRTIVEETTYPEGSQEQCKQPDCSNPAFKKVTGTLLTVVIDGRDYSPADLQETAPLLLSSKLAEDIAKTRRELVICLECLVKKTVNR